MSVDEVVEKYCVSKEESLTLNIRFLPGQTISHLWL